MKNIGLTITGAILLLAVTLLSGFFLTRAGKPYGAGLFNIHKLVSVGAVILMVLISRTIFKSGGGSGLLITVLVIGAASVLTLISTGALMSIKEAVPKSVLRIHRIAPFATIIAAAVTLYLSVRIGR